MTDSKSITNTGLRGVTIASTKICDVDGAVGKLLYRGYLAADLVGQVLFEEVVYLLLFEKLPNKDELAEFNQKLIAERAIPSEITDVMKLYPKDSLPMDVLQSAISLLANYDKEARERSKTASENIAIRLISKVSTIVAAWERIRNGKSPVAPDTSIGHAANFLYMLNGEMPDDEMAAFFDACLILHAEHSFNASTFAAREVASTRAHMYAAVSAAVGSLSGELHGGANTRVMQMLLKIGSIEAVDDYIKDILKSGGVIMGLGHAVYQTDDPRAAILAPMSQKMGERAGETKWFEMSKYLEKKGKEAFKAKKGKDIFVNVDFYSASLYYYMGIAVDMFTLIFAVSRVAGWAAHVIEEQFAGAAPKPMLYRPESDYVGDYCGPAECAFIPMDNR